MADKSTSHVTRADSGSGGNTGIAFVVGILVVVVGVLAYVVFYGGGAEGADDVDITIEGGGSAVEGAAEAVEGAANSVAAEADGN